MEEYNSKLLEIFHLTWPNLTRYIKITDKMNQIEKFEMTKNPPNIKDTDHTKDKISD